MGHAAALTLGLGAPMKNPFIVYDPVKTPIRGLASKRSPSMNAPGSGLMSELQGVRWGDTGILAVRPGITALASAIDGTKLPWGGASVNVFGTNGTVFLGIKDTSTTPDQTRIYYGIDLASAMSELSAASGATQPFGQTRMDAVSGTDMDRPLTVAVVRDFVHEGSDAGKYKDFVVFQNGVDYPRVWDEDFTYLAKHRPINPPSRASSWKALFSWRNAVGLGTGANYSCADSSGTAWSLVETGSDPNKYALLNVLTSGNLNGSASIDAAAAKDWSNCGALILPFFIDKTSQIEHFLDNFKISVIDNSANALVIYDPSGTDKTSYSLVKAVDMMQTTTIGPNKIVNGVNEGGTLIKRDVEKNFYFLSVPLDYGTTTFDASTALKVKFEPIANATLPSIEYNVRFYLMAGSGKVPGGSTYEISYRCSGSRAESYSQALDSDTPLLSALGGPADVHVKVPFSADLLYSVTINFENTDSTLLSEGVDRLMMYRRQVGEAEAVFCSAATLATFSAGSWSFSSGTAGVIRTATDNTDSDDRYIQLPSPGAEHACMPIGSAMISANARLVIGSIDESDPFPGVYRKVSGSKTGFPFRFTTVGYTPGDPETAFWELVPNESVMAFKSGSASVIGSSSIFVFTDESIWLLNTDAIGTRGLLTRIASVGTTSPMSVVEHNGAVYFLDSDMRVRKLTSLGPVPISLGAIDDKLTAIPVTRRMNVVGAWHDFRYHLAYTPSGGTKNTRKLVWSERANGFDGAWESDDAYNAISTTHYPIEFMFSWRPSAYSVTGGYGVSSQSRLIGIGSNTIPYRLDYGTLDVNAKIPVVIRFGEFHDGMWSGMMMKRVGIMGQAQAAVTLNTKRTYKPENVYSTSSMSLASSSAYRWVWDSSTTPTPSSTTAEMNGNAAQLELSGDMIGESEIYAIAVELEARDLHPVAG